MSEMGERITNIIEESRYGGKPSEEIASTIVAAIFEPTQEMIEAGQEAIDECKTADYVWRLMNKVALK